MLTLKRNTIELFVEELRRVYQRTYSNLEPEFGNIIVWTGRLALENISNSDALYHDVEHTVMVTLAGQAILEGKHFSEGGVSPKDWLHFMIALLCHDIGYVRGVCSQDQGNKCATGIGDETVELPAGCTDVSLTPYHIDRSKLFITERFGSELLMGMEKFIDVDTIASYIEMTRFPSPDREEYKDTKNFPGLVRAADLIGQLGDPNYLRKTPALFYEFEEIGVNKEFNYKNPGDLRDTYAKFYWGVISPYIQDALHYLHVTQAGKQWIANLHSHVFVAEHQGLG
jgi:hypothetical protein